MSKEGRPSGASPGKSKKKAAQKPLTIAWSALRAAAKVLNGVAELDVGDGKGAILVAMLPQRRKSDQG